MEQITKLVKAQASAEKAVEMAEMKRRYAAYVEGGMGIDEACEMLRTRGSTNFDRDEDREKVDRMNRLERKNERRQQKCILSSVVNSGFRMTRKQTNSRLFVLHTFACDHQTLIMTRKQHFLQLSLTSIPCGHQQFRMTRKALTENPCLI